MPIARSVAGAKIQVRTPNPPEIKEMPRDPRARAGLTRLGPPPQVRAKGVAQVERPHPAAVAVERVIIVWIRCPMLTEIMLKTPGMSQMIPSIRSGSTTTVTFTR